MEVIVCDDFVIGCIPEKHDKVIFKKIGMIYLILFTSRTKMKNVLFDG
jgi:hypothetical protein